MSIVVNMAQPCKPYTQRESQIYILPTPDEDDDNQVEMNGQIYKKKYMIMKMIEFLIIIVALVFHVLGVASAERTLEDIFISVCFGAFIIYPFIFVMLNFGLTHNKGLIICNLLVTTFLLSVGIFIVNSWWSTQKLLDTIEDTEPKLYLKGQFSSNMRLTSAIICFVNGILYLAESMLLVLETKGYV